MNLASFEESCRKCVSKSVGQKKQYRTQKSPFWIEKDIFNSNTLPIL